MQDGYIYGRGTIDDKGMLAANLAVFISLKRSNARLNRDVIFLAEADEENGGQQGIQFAVEKHWDKIASGFAINENGRVIVKNGKPVYVGIQTDEKVAVNLDVIAAGTAGHASVPRKDNAVTHLAAAMTKIGGYEAPVQFNSVTRAFSKAWRLRKMKKRASGCRLSAPRIAAITPRAGSPMPTPRGTPCCATPPLPP